MTDQKRVVDYEIQKFEIFHGDSGALWANVKADIHDGTDKSFHASVTFRFPLWPDGSMTLDQLANRALTLAKEQLQSPGKLLQNVPTEWRSPGQ